ncbi:glycoside hydrolase family 9 protein [Kiritimatiella glycovorans]|uniref:Glycosyl hydrolase family 9 n=1 Tax=Kiritimatiella glycovorans TaxID=1307763 RepID=A0A0G3EDQ6_9BACT|nr:glycoside hydrolase family 9 protein [Kiritimatiella glycovorans]AKJ64468.1 Glycosyl hydrolase family 9 [Kiritimatiella glycovorans]
MNIRGALSSDLQLSVSHLGYRPDSPKTVTLVGATKDDLPEQIPFYLRRAIPRLKRTQERPDAFGVHFPWPFDPMNGEVQPERGEGPGRYVYEGMLVREETRWGTVWQGDFSSFCEPGAWAIETEYQISPPFMIRDRVYERLELGFLNFLHAQRCGCEVPGVHEACHLDDGVLEDGTPWPAAGGWHDAGDVRKWLALTQGNLEGLVTVAEHGHHAFRDRACDEIRWGNHLFHAMITEEGQVFEDVAGGEVPPVIMESSGNLEDAWWYENHPGCSAAQSDNRWTDNRPGSGDERLVRRFYNPAVQFAFVHHQRQCSRVLPDADGVRCRMLAERAWRYGRGRGHDGRTLFVAQELLAALEMNEMDAVRELAGELIARQETGDETIRGFFYEKDRVDAYRSITFAESPVWALLKLIEFAPAGLDDLIGRAREAVAFYCDGYLVTDAASNPFSLVPYGVYVDPPHPGHQTFRDAGGGRGIRSFIQVFGRQGVIHGTSGVVLAHAAVLAKAAALLDRPEWRRLAERQIQWTLGHNIVNRSLYNGIGYRQPVFYGALTTQIPDATCVGFIGRPDDTPYLEESLALIWSTLEIWDVPYHHLMKALPWITG